MIEFVTLDNAKEYEEFIENHKKGHFAQSTMWAKQKKEWKWDGILCRDENGVIKGAMSVLTRRVHRRIPLALMYACRGPVCDIHDRDTIRELTDGARALAKKNNAYVLKIDPDVLSSDKEFVSIMEELGYKCQSSGKNFEGIQPQYVFRLDVKDKTEEEMLQIFSSKTRYNIGLARRKGVEVKLCSHEAMGDFAALMKTTGIRDGFVTRPQKYFDDMLDNLGEHARLYMAYYEGIPVAGTLAIWYGNKVWYLYGASANEYRNLMPNYLCQWNMIQWALHKKCDIYDFRGVSGDLDESNPLYGLYRFKKGFNGEFCEFAGEFDMVFSRFWYAVIRKAERAYRHMRKVVYLKKNRT